MYKQPMYIGVEQIRQGHSEYRINSRELKNVEEQRYLECISLDKKVAETEVTCCNWLRHG